MASPSISQRPAKFAPRVALVQLDPSAIDTLTKAFSQCGAQAIPIGADFHQRFTREQFQGCVLRLDDHASEVLDAVRSSRSNSKAILYGITSANADMRRFFKYGINAVLDSRMDRSAVLNTARSTCALLLNELRRYVRIPIVVEVTVEAGEEKLTGSSREISGGGMSVEMTREVRFGASKLRLAFALPEKAPANIAVAVCWQKGSMTGFQFQDYDAGRQIVKDWISQFLGLA